MPPDECFQLDDGGQPVTCTQQPDGTWTPDSSPFAPHPLELATLGFLVVLLLGVAGTVWRVRAARSMARRAGLDQGEAVRMALASEDGLTATYLASSLRGTPGAAPVVRDTATRLRELDRLRSEGLVTEDEHATRRAAILDDV
ncbi:hypothetical protein ASG94_19100 [Nocardioides sp. Soil805]|nr:hypothetical protein ASG94_19100 [Nocardioides sp. Soil805]